MVKQMSDSLKCSKSYSCHMAKGAQTRQSLLDAAVVRFGRDGYRATSVADIAREASVGGTLAFTYFANKEALFLAALDQDAAEVINEGVANLLSQPEIYDWLPTLMATLVGAVERHPLARRVLAGLEPDVTQRVLDMPALAELRTVCADRLRDGQRKGRVRPDIDAVTIANGVVALVLSLLMSAIQVGIEIAEPYASDIAAVFDAAIGPSPEKARRPLRLSPAIDPGP